MSVVQVVDPDGDILLPGLPSASDKGIMAMNNVNGTSVNISVTPSSTVPGLDPLKDRDPQSSLASPLAQSLSTPLAFLPSNHINLKTPSCPVSLSDGDLISSVSVSSQNSAATTASIPVLVSKAGAQPVASPAACAVLTPTPRQQCALKRLSTVATPIPTRTHRASPSNASNLTIPSSTTIQSSSDGDFGSVSASVSDRDGHDENGTGNEGTRACVNAGGKKPKRPRKDRLTGAGESDDDDDDDLVGAKGSRSRRSLRVSDRSDDRRPLKRARIHVEEADIDIDAQDNSETPSDEGCRQGGARSPSNLRTQPRARTQTPEREQLQDKSPSPSGSRMSWSPSPLPRPVPSRFHSSSSCSTVSSGSPFPTTPPSRGAGSPSAPIPGSTFASCSFSHSHNSTPGSGPQPFWFGDGDLVLFVSPLASAVMASSGSQCVGPLLSASASSNVNLVYANQDLAPASSSPSLPGFRIHAARLVQASSAFAGLLASPFPDNPLEEDSARAAREIAQRLRAYTRSRRGSGADEVKFGGASFVKDDEEEYEVCGGCPAVRLEGDAYRDWIVALEAMYEPMSFQVRPVVFEVLASALRIATRYEMRQLREWAVAQLRTTWPSHVERMSPVALPNAADAIALSRECGVPEILPAAFYALAVQRWRPRSVYTYTPSSVGGIAGLPRAEVETCGTDGGRAHAVLDPMDLRRLVMGREALEDVLVEIVADPLTVGRSMLSEDEFAAAGLGEEKASKSRGFDGMYHPPSPSPSRSPSPKIPTLLAVPAPVASGLMTGAPTPALPSVSGGADATMVSVSESASVPTFQRCQSFSSSSASSYGFSSSFSSTATMLANSNASGTPTFSFCSPSASGCRAMLETLWRKRLAPDRRRAWGTWLARELYRLATLPRAQMNYEITGVPGGSYDVAGEVKKENEKGQGGREDVCLRCWEENSRLALWRLDRLCAAIPGMFML